MQARFFLPSVARIADFDRVPFQTRMLPRRQWATGDYVSAEVVGRPNPLYTFELTNGRMVKAMEGDRAIGALGRRTATLEGVGSWEEVGPDLLMHGLTGAGLFGKATSQSRLLPPLMTLVYTGHVVRDGRKLGMQDFVEPVPERALRMPTVLLFGTSMSAGKTTAGRIIVHELKKAGLAVVGAKLTGAGRYRDILSFSDAGADHILDFVDVGLPATVCAEAKYRLALRQLMSRIAALDADVLVAEAGASPLEPYNGAAAIDELGSNVRFSVLCASDPYAAVGVKCAFGLTPDLITGPATTTDAAITLVEKLTGVTGLNVTKRASLSALRTMLSERLGVKLPEA